MNKTILEEAARRFGTPCYVISGDDFARRANAVKEAFGENTGLCYSIKANPFLLKYLPDAFSYIEVCSPGELSICEELSVPMSKVIFSGVNKTERDVERAWNDGVGLFTAESLLHVRLINARAKERRKGAADTPAFPRQPVWHGRFRDKGSYPEPGFLQGS